MKKFLSIFFAAFFAFCFLTNINFNIAKAQTIKKQEEQQLNEFESSALSFVVIEEGTGKVLFEKNKSKKLPLASITKVQTLNVIFDEIENGSLKLKDEVLVSGFAAGQEGSQAFLDEGKKYRVDDLIKTVVVCSANDSAVALAEKVGGTEKRFVQKMNALAERMGLSNTHFENSTGLPLPNHYSSAEDISKMFAKLSKNDLYNKYAKIWLDELIHSSGRKTELLNTNKLIRSLDECVSGKTGYTDEAKHCLVAKCSKDGMNLIVALLGAKTSKERFDDVKSLFGLGYANFEIKEVIESGENFGQIDVKRGKQKQVNVVASESFCDVVPKGVKIEYEKKINLPNSVRAPISAGEHLGEVEVFNNAGEKVKTISLVSQFDVEKSRFKDIFSNINKQW